MTLKIYKKIKNTREKYLEIGLKSANRPLIFYVFASVLAYTKKSKENTKVLELANQAMKD